jgi:hypothetical protein
MDFSGIFPGFSRDFARISGAASKRRARPGNAAFLPQIGAERQIHRVRLAEDRNQVRAVAAGMGAQAKEKAPAKRGPMSLIGNAR